MLSLVGCGTVADDHVYICGSIGNDPPAFVPHCKTTQGLRGKQITSVSAGWAHCTAHGTSGCYLWGSEQMPNVDRLPNAIRGANILPRNYTLGQVVSGGSHTVMLLHVPQVSADQYFSS